MKKITLVRLNKTLKNSLFRCLSSSKFKLIYCLLLLIAALILFVPAAQAVIVEKAFEDYDPSVQTAVEIREISPGENVEREGKTNEIHAYQITLQAGTSIEITFGKRNAVTQLSALLPDSRDYIVSGKSVPVEKELARVVASSDQYLVERFVVVAEQTGNYILRVRVLASGTYSFNVGDARPATERDRKYAAAGKLFAEIRQVFDRGESMGKMRGKAEERATIYRYLDDKKSLALSLNDVGRTFSADGEYLKATKYFDEALELFRALNSVAHILSNLDTISRFSLQTGDYQTAIDNYSEALSLTRSTANKSLEAGILHQLGVTYHLLADEQKARDFYEQSLSVRRTLVPVDANVLNGEAVTLINIGNLYRGVEANEIVIDALGTRTVRDREIALEYYKKALEIARKVKESFPNTAQKEAYNLLQIGNTLKELGKYSEALVYLNESFELYKTSPVKTGQVYCLMALGNLYALKNDYQKSAENYEKAITYLKEGADNAYQAKYFNIVAADYYRAGTTQKALDLYSEALTLSRNRGHLSTTAESLFEIARIERDLGNFNNARNRIEESIQTVESVRARITSQNVRTTYFSTVKNYYDFYIDLLMQAHKSQPEKGFDTLALKMNEQARSRSLLDLLTLSKIDVKQGVDPALLEREKEVRERLSEKASRQSRLLLGNYAKEEAEKIKAEVSNLTNEYEAVQTEIRNKSPRYAALTQPTSLDTKQIQQLLDSGTILLEYSLGEKKSYLWAVSADSVTSFDLPPRAEIESQARQVYELLTARNQNLQGESDEQKRARIKTAEDEYGRAASRLSEMLLGQIAAQIGNKRLLIVADGALNYISFAALPSPKAGETGNQPLGTNHEIVTLPSASILALLRQETGGRKPAPKMLAVFADPVFNQTDVRAGKTKQAAEVSRMNKKSENTSFNRDFERAVSGVGLRESDGLPRLPFSRREADSIFRVSPRNLSLRETDFDASKANVFNSDLDQYRILHFATHGLLNSQHPELSGFVLSLVDKNGNEIDGFVRLQDIYNLKLSADLVVLSACQTALGKDVKGEGLISLTRGFMYAGAPRIVASLWKVDDAATAELMSIFYRKMLGENLRPAAALRAAQTEMMRQTRWKSPYYWAGFTIQGEWR